MILVFDTNVLIAAALKGGFSLTAIRLAVDGEIILASSEEILTELREKLGSKFQWSAEASDLFVNTLREVSVIVEPDKKINLITRDPEDNIILQVAATAQADLVISSDKDVLQLKQFKIPSKTIGIVHPRDLHRTIPGFFQEAG